MNRCRLRREEALLEKRKAASRKSPLFLTMKMCPIMTMCLKLNQESKLITLEKGIFVYAMTMMQTDTYLEIQG